MVRPVPKCLLPCLLALVIMPCSSSGQARRKPGATTGQAARDEQSAVAALARARVPLQKDGAGRVRWIEARRGEVDDAALAQISHLRALEWLDVTGRKITHEGLTELGGCRNLRRLYLHDVDLGGHDPTWLSGLVHLESLSLARTGISGKPLRDLQRDGLRVLNLSGTRVTDDDLAEVAQLKYLEVLALQDTRVSGAGLEKLAGMQRLNVLNLSNSRITDADLRHFISMPNLRIVHAAGCSISDRAVDGMRKQLPMLSIFR